MRGWLLVVLCCGLLACTGRHDGDPSGFVGTDISGAAFGNALALTDHHGRPRTLADFRGKVVALFFGYTHCPDVCPTTMDDLSKALKLLGDRRGSVQVLFVTLDPERDTQEVLAKYVPAFDKSFIGLYGDAATTERVARDSSCSTKSRSRRAGAVTRSIIAQASMCSIKKGRSGCFLTTDKSRRTSRMIWRN